MWSTCLFLCCFPRITSSLREGDLFCLYFLRIWHPVVNNLIECWQVIVEWGRQTDTELLSQSPLYCQQHTPGFNPLWRWRFLTLMLLPWCSIWKEATGNWTVSRLKYIPPYVPPLLCNCVVPLPGPFTPRPALLGYFTALYRFCFQAFKILFAYRIQTTILPWKHVLLPFSPPHLPTCCPKWPLATTKPGMREECQNENKCVN